MPSVDQVIRREQLERRFPERVTFSCVDRVHRATVRQRGAIYEVADHELRTVLDRAEQLLTAGK
jgi:hypothetical protein